MRRLQDAKKRRTDFRHLFPHLFDDDFIDAFFRKINDGFQMRQKRQNILPHGAYALRKVTGEMPRRHFQAFFRLRAHDIHDSLRLSEIEPAVQKGAFRELAALCRTRTVTIGQCQNLAQGDSSAMALQLHDIFPRIRMRRTHDEAKSLIDKTSILSHDRAIEKLAYTRIDKIPAVCSAKHPLSRLYGRRAGEAHDADASFSHCRRNGADRIRLLQYATPCKERKGLSLAATARFKSIIKPSIILFTHRTVHARNAMLRLDDDLAERLVSCAVGEDAMVVLKSEMYDLPLMTVHRLQNDALIRAAAAFRQTRCQAVERLLATLAIILDIQDDAHALFRRSLVGCEIDEILQGVERLPVLADEDAEVVPREVQLERMRALAPLYGDIQLHRLKDLLQEIFRLLQRRLGICRTRRCANSFASRTDGGRIRSERASDRREALAARRGK